MRLINGPVRLLMMIALVAVMGALIAACGEDEEEGSSRTLRIGMLADYDTLDPPKLLGLPGTITVEATYDVLVMRNPDLTLQPMLATSWEANDDASEWTFKLREGVRFAHGKEFTAEDVIYTFNRMFEVESALASVMAKPTAIVAVDDYTVRFEFGTPNAVLLESIVKYHAHITPSDVDPARFALETFGTGPFRMTELVIGERAVFERNEDYWWEGHPLVDKMEYIFLTSPEARAEALKAGTIDVVFDLEISSIQTIEDHPDTKVIVAPSGSYMALAMDVREAPFDDILVRKAMQAATDREAILQGAQFGRGDIAYDHPIPPTATVFNDACLPPGYDPELAKSLLTRAGYPEGLDVTLYTSTAGAAMVEMATVFKERAAPAGINVEIVVVSEDNYWADTWMKKPFTTVWWGGRPPYEGISVVYVTGAAWGESFYSNARVDELLEIAFGQGDLEDQKETFGELQCIIVDEVPRIIPVFRPVSLGLRNDVQGMDPMWDGTMTVHRVYFE